MIKLTPLQSSLIMWLNSLCWLLYGVMISKDLMIIGPNLLGLLLASLQLLLFLVFGFPPLVDVKGSYLPH